MTKAALLIGVSEYEAGFPPLLSARQDVIAVRQVLEHPEIGGFNKIYELLDPDRQSMEEAIEVLFAESDKNDLVLLFFSGHGIKDDRGRLYFATRHTRKTEAGELMRATAVAANFIHDIMANSRAKRQVIVLDCCFSGAFATEMSAKAGQTENIAADIQAQLGSEGRVVLTSSTATQYSFEANQLESNLSIYTRYLTEGLSTGAADLDSNGVISIDELHEYARARVQEAAPAMKPEIYAVREGYKIQIAKAPVGDPRLLYRKEVEELVRSSHGEISPLDRRILNAQAANLNLDPEAIRVIEAEVLQPYQERKRRLQEYEQAWAEVVQQESGISDVIRTKLKRLQQALKLRDEDVVKIEAAMPAREQKPASTLTSTPQSTSVPQLTSPLTSADKNSTDSKLSRQQFLKLGFGSFGLVVVLVACTEILKASPSSSESASFLNPKLKSFSFGITTIDDQGKATNRRAGQAESFAEDLKNDILLEMVKIPSGVFSMGSPETEKGRFYNESPQHIVTIPAFFMSKFAVTQAQYQAVMGNNPASFRSEQRPVETVSWNEAVEFCTKLSKQMGRAYRLPSEAEWEYACRAGTSTPFHFGETLISALANYDATEVYQRELKGEYRQQTTEVGTFSPNSFGLYDMHGNIWEWCADRWHEEYQEAPSDGIAWLTINQSAARVVRGGSWSSIPRECRSACRDYFDPRSQSNNLGFRVVCILS